MELNQRQSIHQELHDVWSWYPETSFIEVTEWVNGDGYDVTLSNKEGQSTISIAIDELDLLNYLISSLNFKSLLEKKES